MIRQTLVFTSPGDSVRIRTAFDTGAAYNCIRSDKMKVLGQPTDLSRPRDFGQETFKPPTIKITRKITLNFYIGCMLLSDEFLVVPSLREEAIIGAATMQKWRIKLDFGHDTVYIDSKVAKMQLV